MIGNSSPPAGVADSGAGSRRGYSMVFRAFLAQNVVIGCAFGGFGVSVLPLQEKFDASRGAVTLALALCVLALGLVSPMLGSLIARIGLRRMMIAGTLLSAAGYALLAVAPGMTAVLLLYAFPIGIGLAMSGPIASSVLASNWFAHNPGPALGVANMPLFVAVLPMVGQALIRDHGLPTFYLTLAGLNLLAVPFLLGIVDRPADSRHDEGNHSPAPPPMMAAGILLRRPIFWAICIGAGYLNAVGITGISHLVAFVSERGVSGSEGALLLSIMGGASVIGSLLVGLLCGRLGAARTLVLIASLMCLAWLVLRSTTQFAPMAGAVLLAGAGGAGVFPAISMLCGQLFGQASLARAIGLLGLLTLPFTFCLPPLAGVLRDAMNGYDGVVAILIGGSAVVAILFMSMTRQRRSIGPGVELTV